MVISVLLAIYYKNHEFAGKIAGESPLLARQEENQPVTSKPVTPEPVNSKPVTENSSPELTAKPSKPLKKPSRKHPSHPENMPNPIVLDSTPADKPEAIVVFCHGLGDTGDGWSWAFKDPSIRNPKVKYLFPTADTQPVSLNGGFPMPSWYDLYGLSPSTKEDEAGIKKAADKINSLINTELEKYPHLTEKNVIVGGFSQGGALAFYTGLSNSKSPYGAIIGLSTYLPLRDEFLKDESAKLNAVQGTKIFQAHGDDDQVVPFQFGQLTSKVIKQTSLDAVFKSYSGMGHSSCEQEMNDVKNFISQVVLANM